jgi:ubiquitin-activating enzyme E1
VYDRHYLQDGNYVVFKEVQGMEEINNTPPRPVRVVSPCCFSIEDTTGYSYYLKEGVAEHFKIPEKLRFKSLEASLSRPAFCGPSPRRSEQLHIALRALDEFTKIHKTLPGDAGQALEVYSLACALNQAAKDAGGLHVAELDKELILAASSSAHWQLPALGSFWGALLSSEVVKFTGKYSPLLQWFASDWLQLQGAIVPSLAGQSGLVVGAGALGSEVLKLCAQMRTRTVTVVDKSRVKESDRHLFYPANAVGELKAQVAAARLEEKALQVRWEAASISQAGLSDQDWASFDWVVSAVDNHAARLEIDRLCVWHLKSMVEGSVSATLGHCNVYLPHKTSSYAEAVASAEPAVDEAVVLHFPYSIEHCVEFAKRKFDLYFSDTMAEFCKFVAAPASYVQNITLAERAQAMHIFYDYLELLRSGSFEDCVRYARECFAEIFHNSVARLLQEHPQEARDEADRPFWTGFRRVPTATGFEGSDDLHVHFVESFAQLLASALSIPAKKINVREVKQLEVVRTHSATDLAAILSAHTPGEFAASLVPKELNVDEPLHSEFIYCCSTLRARGYRILEIDHFSTEIIAGNINGCLPSTCSLIASCVCLELCKLAIATPSNMSVNLAGMHFVHYEPASARKIHSTDFDPQLCAPVKAVPEDFTVWDRVNLQGPLTIAQLLAHFENQGLRVTLISSGKQIIYNSFSPDTDALSRLVESIVPPSQGVLSLDLEMSCEESSSSIAVRTPLVRYSLPIN